MPTMQLGPYTNTHSTEHIQPIRKKHLEIKEKTYKNNQKKENKYYTVINESFFILLWQRMSSKFLNAFSDCAHHLVITTWTERQTVGRNTWRHNRQVKNVCSNEHGLVAIHLLWIKIISAYFALFRFKLFVWAQTAMCKHWSVLDWMLKVLGPR